MSLQNFSLRPFSVDAGSRPVVIDGVVSRLSQTLTIEYLLTGRLAAVAIPDRAPAPLRLDGLWRQTCFECFIAGRNSPQYWEFNISPAGHWNVYRFSNYRQGMTEEKAFQHLPFTRSAGPGLLSLALQIDLAKILDGDQRLEVAISAVIQYKNADLDYWALTHADAAPDFHRRECFTIRL
jgi:hypothetical protein